MTVGRSRSRWQSLLQDLGRSIEMRDEKVVESSRTAEYRSSHENLARRLTTEGKAGLVNLLELVI